MFSGGDGNQGTPRGDPAGLPDVVQLVVGMKVMVTYNIGTELDIANGARGTVERIITPSAHLAAEDERLEELDSATRKKHERLIATRGVNEANGTVG
ncbi:hypothetical protein FS749_003399 [Ceratobasidium sp. UAMH 11750]|nr:hypothetical protein FS749_003399 [Ceratobasidium sp. UAMH 11750]